MPSQMLAGPPAADSDVSRGPRTQSDIQARSDIQVLLAGARREDRQSIGELLLHFRGYLTLLATTHIQRRLRPRVSPSDVVQETMLRAHRHFAQFRGQSERELVAWLREILITSLARFVEQYLLAAKRDLRREVSLNRFPGELAGSSSGEQPLGQQAAERAQLAAFPRASGSEPSDLLADLLARLPEHYRQVLVLRNIQGFSFKEIATRLGRSPGATRMLWLRAIEKLRAINRKAEQHDP